MQQTDKYQFNLIETSDTFSPEALNQNAQKLEDALVTHEAVVDSALKSQKLEWQAADDALTARLTAETAAREALDVGQLRYKYGVRPGDGAQIVRLDFDFKPLLVIVSSPFTYSRGGYPWIRGTTLGLAYSPDATRATVQLTWEDRAVQWSSHSISSNSTPNDWLNAVGYSYPYFAVGIVE